MNYIITYANKKYKNEQNLCSNSAIKFGKFDKSIEFSSDNIDEKFKNVNSNIFKEKRGDGLWLWKPYIILKSLETVNEGDIVFYADSGVFFIKNCSPIFKIIEENKFFITELYLREWQFTKAETFNELNVNSSKYKESNQCSASFLGFLKCDETVDFVKEWLDKCCNFIALSPQIFKIRNPNGFVQHREDQSILSLLCKEHGYKTYNDISEYGIYPEMYYISKKVIRANNIQRTKGIPFVLHYRRRKDLKRNFVKTIFLLALPRKIASNVILCRKKKLWEMNR